jgi:hypothetical protein
MQGCGEHFSCTSARPPTAEARSCNYLAGLCRATFRLFLFLFNSNRPEEKYKKKKGKEKEKEKVKEKPWGRALKWTK